MAGVFFDDEAANTLVSVACGSAGRLVLAAFAAFGRKLVTELDFAAEVAEEVEVDMCEIVGVIVMTDKTVVSVPVGC